MDAAPTKFEVGPGSVIAETYRIERRLGEGGMGIVFEAQHLRVPRRVAIKILREQPDAELLARFRQEAEVTSRLRHDGIVDVLDFNTLPNGAAYIVMEMLEGESLAARMKEHGAFTGEEALPILREIAAALHAAHCAGVVHRDLKPENVFLVKREHDGELVDTVKVLDFGISKVHGSSIVRTRDDVVLGTPRYMAPEQALALNEDVDPRCDQFALGVIAYEMLTGTVPFTATNSAQLMFQIAYEPPLPLATRGVRAAPRVVAAIDRAMSKQPSDRFDDLSAFVEALTGRRLAETDRSSYPVLSAAVLPGAPGGAREGTATVPSKPRPKLAEPPTIADRPVARRRWPLLAALAAVAAAGVVTVLVLGANREPAVKDTSDVVTIAPADAREAIAPAPPVDAPSLAAAPADATIGHGADAGGHDVKKAPPTRGTISPEAAEALQDAQTALAAGDFDEADRAARRALRGGPVPRAYELLVEVECGRRNLPAVHGWLRNLARTSWPRMHARCTKLGFDFTDPP